MGKLAKRIEEKFGFDVTGLAAYTDEQSTEILKDLIFSANLTSRIQVLQNVKGSQKIKLMSASLPLQSAASCGWSESGDMVLTNETITTSRLKIQASFCNEDLVDTWGQLLLAIGANRQDTELPFADVLTAYAIKTAQKKNQDLMFNGDTGSGNPDLAHYDGYVKLWDADAGLVEVTTLVTAATGFTNANAFNIALEVYEGIPAEVFDNGIAPEIICSRSTARKILTQIYNDKDYAGSVAVEDNGGELSFILPTTNTKVRSYPQLADNKMYAVPYEYMFFGTDLENDVDGFEAKYNETDENIRFGVKFNSGVQYVLPQYFVKLTFTP